VFPFLHRLDELSNYGECIISLCAATNPIFHNRVIKFDKAVRRQVRSVQNAELWDHDRFIDLKIAHIDSIRVAINIGLLCTDSNHGRNQRSKPRKKDEPCNNWNNDKCSQMKEECQRQHVCNMCGKAGYKGKECKQHTK
jgi:hypothetical protein